MVSHPYYILFIILPSLIQTKPYVISTLCVFMLMRSTTGQVYAKFAADAFFGGCAAFATVILKAFLSKALHT